VPTKIVGRRWTAGDNHLLSLYQAKNPAVHVSVCVAGIHCYGAVELGQGSLRIISNHEKPSEANSKSSWERFDPKRCSA